MSESPARWIPYTKTEYTLIWPVDEADMEYNPASQTRSPAPSAFEKEGGVLFAEAHNPENMSESVREAKRKLEESGTRVGPEHVIHIVREGLFKDILKAGQPIRLEQDEDRPWRIRMVSGKTP